MRTSLLFASALGASTIMAAPTWPALNVGSAMPGDVQVLTDYFNLLAQKVQEGRSMSQAPICDLSKASMPQAPVALPAPMAGLTLKHVAIGRGTQNYTCDTTNATAVPVAVGANATLFNATCIAATYPDLLTMLPKMALQFNLTVGETQTMGPSNLAISGHHFFTTLTTPFFNLDTTSMQLGQAACTKANSSAAPADAPAGPDGSAAVPWLQLTTRNGTTGNIEEIYRVETAGGSAPKTCAGQPAEFFVQYAAQYWIWQGEAESS